MRLCVARPLNLLNPQWWMLYLHVSHCCYSTRQLPYDNMLMLMPRGIPIPTDKSRRRYTTAISEV
jgi:hypothetical protein